MPTTLCIDSTKMAEYIVKHNMNDYILKYIKNTLTDTDLNYISDLIILEEETEYKEQYNKYYEGKLPYHEVNFNFDPENSKRNINQYIEYYKKASNDTHVRDIAICAVDMNNKNVLNLIRKDIKVKYVNDGNDYNLITLFADNLTYAKYRKDDPELFNLLCQIADENDEDIHETLGYGSRFVLKIKKDDYVTNDYDLIIKYLDLFISKNISLWNVYHYSIAWNEPMIVKYLIDNYSDRIDFKNWTSDALDVATDFESTDAIKFCNENITPIMLSEDKDLDRPTVYALKKS